MIPINILESTYSQITNQDNRGKSDLYYCIIQIKINTPDFYNCQQSLYKDIKMFILYHIKSLDDLDFGYDSFNRRKIITAINYAKTDEEKYELSAFSYRLLLHYEIEDEVKYFKKLAYQLKSKVFFNKRQFLKLFFNLTAYNFFAILLSIFLIFLFNVIVFLPAPFKCFEILTIKYHNYTNCFFLNHVGNIISNIFSIKSNFEVAPVTFWGILLLVTIKILYISVIINYLYKQILEIFK